MRILPVIAVGNRCINIQKNTDDLDIQNIIRKILK